MNRPRWVALAVAAALSLLSGCQGSSGCNGGYMGRLTSHRGVVVYDGPVLATPYGGSCCEGGPMLADPTYGQPVPMMPPNGMVMPGGNGMVVPGGPAPTLPTPTPTPLPNTGPPPLAPVPGPSNPPLATPVPAGPAVRRR